jgi:nucleotide-binding universal stress UspA family protein
MLNHEEILNTGNSMAPRHTTKITKSIPKKDSKKNFLDITALIRSLQRNENKADCFQKGYDTCEDIECNWRKYCLEGQPVGNKEQISRLVLKKTRRNPAMRVKIKNIMCSTDFSDLSNQALPYGIALAKEFGAKLFVCHVIDLPPTTVNGDVHLYSLEAQNRSLDYAFEQLEQLMGKQVVAWEPLIIIGHTADEICRMAEAKRIDLAISATHGRSGLKRIILGSVTERLMRTLPCPLLIIRSPATDFNFTENLAFGFHRILVGCDFSSDSNLALEYGISLAQEFQSELHLVHVIEPPVYRDLRKLAKEMEEEDHRDLEKRLNDKLANLVPEEIHNWCTLKTTLLNGHPYKELTKYAESHDLDLIILGVRGRGLVETLCLGSTTDRVARRASCPLLSVRPAMP